MTFLCILCQESLGSSSLSDKLSFSSSVEEEGLLADALAFRLTGNDQCQRPLVVKMASFWLAPHLVPVMLEPEEPGLEEGPRSGEVEPMWGRSFLVAGEGPAAGVELDVKVDPFAGEAIQKQR